MHTRYQSQWLDDLEKKLPIGVQVQTYHRGKHRVGNLEKLARKASTSHGEAYVWVTFPELMGDYYYRKLMRLRGIA